MRLFLAINLDPETRQAIAGATARLRDEAPEIRWTDALGFHLTLKFLGDQPVEVAESLARSMSEIADRHRRFPIRIRDVGAFPNFRRARVVWIGVDADTRLELLHHDVEVGCERLGFALEGRAFRPHVTIARVKEGTSLEVLRRLSRAGKKVAFQAETNVDSIDVMKSNPGASEPDERYELLHAASLGA